MLRHGGGPLLGTALCGRCSSPADASLLGSTRRAHTLGNLDILQSWPVHSFAAAVAASPLAPSWQRELVHGAAGHHDGSGVCDHLVLGSGDIRPDHDDDCPSHSEAWRLYWFRYFVVCSPPPDSRFDHLYRRADSTRPRHF